MVESEDHILLNASRKAKQLSPNKERHSLYLRFPKKLNIDRVVAESEVRALNSKIINVRIPRQPSANFCLVDFLTKTDKVKAFKQLKNTEINDKHLIVKEAVRNDRDKVKRLSEKNEVKREVNHALRQLVGDIKKTLVKNYRKKSLTNLIVVKNLKKGTTEADIRKSFPSAMDVKINMKSDRTCSSAFITLATPTEAKQATKRQMEICGQMYSVGFQKDPQNDQDSQKNHKTGNDEISSSNSKESDSDDQNVGSDDELESN